MEDNGVVPGVDCMSVGIPLGGRTVHFARSCIGDVSDHNTEADDIGARIERQEPGVEDGDPSSVGRSQSFWSDVLIGPNMMERMLRDVSGRHIFPLWK